MGSILVQKKSLEEGPISQKLLKNCKISNFLGRKWILEMGLDLQNDKKKTVESVLFWVRKIPRYG